MTKERDSIDRRRLLQRGAAAAGLAAIWGPAQALGLSRREAGGGFHRPTVVYDVACFLNTFTPIVADGSTNPDSDFRGTTFFVEGDLYPEGTIPDGSTDFDPASATPIGHWLCRGWFINRSNRPGETDRPEPHVLTHQEYLIGRITPDSLFPADQLTSSGLEGSAGSEVAVRSVVGGTGRYVAAAGAVRQHTIGANTTGGPNFRFAFRLKRGRRWP